MSDTNYCTGDSKSSSRRLQPVRRRLALLVVTLVIGVVLVGWVVNRTWSRLEQLQHEFLTTEAETFYLGLRCRAGLERLDGALLKFQLSKSDPAERELFNREGREFAELITEAKPSLATPEERRLAEELQMAFDRYLSNAVPLLEKGVRAVRRDSAAEVSDQILGISAPVREICDRLVVVQKAAWKSFFDASHRTLGSLWQWSLLTLALLLVFAFAVGFLAYRSAVAPLRFQLSQTQSVLDRQEKLASLGTLAAGVAHEVRNPLASLKFRLFSLKQSLPPDFAGNDDVSVIDDEIHRLERIVKDFLLFARPSEPAFAEVVVEQILQSVRNLLGPQLEARRIRLAVEPGNRLRLRVDRNQIEQVVINLVQNAADSIEGAGTVTLSAREGAARFGRKSLPAVILEVADTGKGIPPEVQKRLFDPFFSTKAAGTGLGLSISERIVEMHGGLLQFQTRASHGTTFQIVLPKDSNHAGKNSVD